MKKNKQREGQGRARKGKEGTLKKGKWKNNNNKEKAKQGKEGNYGIERQGKANDKRGHDMEGKVKRGT